MKERIYKISKAWCVKCGALFFWLLLMLTQGSSAATAVKDKDSALIFHPNLAGPRVYESKVIVTESTIRTITATWDFSGEVRLEISANNGIDYTPVVNGRPLEMGHFVPGNQLRYKALLESDSYLHQIKIGYTDMRGERYGYGNPELSGFKFRKAIEIAGIPDGDLFNYQLKLKIGESEQAEDYDLDCEGNIESDFRDVYFTGPDAETSLSYYLESIEGEPGKRGAVFWVKIPQLPPEGLKIYLYYAKPQAQNLSSGEDVFDFFDDFTGVQLNQGKWDAYTELNGDLSLKDSQLRLNNSSILSHGFKLQDGIIEFRATVMGNCGIEGIVRDEKETARHSPLRQTVYSSAFPGAEHTIAVGNLVKVNAGSRISPETPYLYRIIAEGLNLIFQRDSFLTGERQAELHFSDIGGLTKGYIGLGSNCGPFNQGAVYIDWIRVRQFARFQPQIVSIGEQERLSPKRIVLNLSRIR